MYANGNSFSSGPPMPGNAARIREPWYIRLLSGIQDRGGT